MGPAIIKFGICVHVCMYIFTWYVQKTYFFTVRQKTSGQLFVDGHGRPRPEVRLLLQGAQGSILRNSFRPKTFGTNFHTRILVKVAPKNNIHKFIWHQYLILRCFKATRGLQYKPKLLPNKVLSVNFGRNGFIKSAPVPECGWGSWRGPGRSSTGSTCTCKSPCCRHPPCRRFEAFHWNLVAIKGLSLQQSGGRLCRKIYILTTAKLWASIFACQIWNACQHWNAETTIHRQCFRINVFVSQDL
jgi:hypothetical protein